MTASASPMTLARPEGMGLRIMSYRAGLIHGKLDDAPRRCRWNARELSRRREDPSMDQTIRNEPVASTTSPPPRS